MKNYSALDPKNTEVKPDYEAELYKFMRSFSNWERENNINLMRLTDYFIENKCYISDENFNFQYQQNKKLWFTSKINLKSAINELFKKFKNPSPEQVFDFIKNFEKIEKYEQPILKNNSALSELVPNDEEFPF